MNDEERIEQIKKEISAIDALLANRRRRLEAKQELITLEFKLLKETEDLLYLAKGELNEEFNSLESLLNISGVKLDDPEDDE